MDIIQIFAFAKRIGDAEQARRRETGESLMPQMEYGNLVGNITLFLLKESEDPNLRRLAEQTRNIGLGAQEKK